MLICLIMNNNMLFDFNVNGKQTTMKITKIHVFGPYYICTRYDLPTTNITINAKQNRIIEIENIDRKSFNRYIERKRAKENLSRIVSIHNTYV